MQYDVTLLVNYEQVVRVETDNEGQVAEMARAQVDLPGTARGFVGVLQVEFAPMPDEPSRVVTA